MTIVSAPAKPLAPPQTPGGSTLLERAHALREEARQPRTIGDLTPEQTAKLDAELSARMRPRLIAAAREQRALNASDLKALDGVDNGDGLVLDDILEFLLSPAGAPLQAVLAQKLEPATRPDPFGFDSDDNTMSQATWTAPPRDSFEQGLRAVIGKSAFHSGPALMTNAVVAGFAALTGKNGVVDEAAVHQTGSFASGLYLRIAQGLGDQALNNRAPGDPLQGRTGRGQKLVGLDDATVARVGRGFDLDPILERMPAFHAVTDALIGDRQPLKGVKVVCIQHFMPTFGGVLQALEQAGVERGDMRLIGKSYSTVDEMYAWLVGQGYAVDKGSIGGSASSVEEKLVEAARGALEELFDGVDPTTSPQRFLLADDGGKLLYALHKYFPQYAPLCAGFEQTARGIQVLDKMVADGQPVLCPVINMAHSQLKNDSEIPLIGENVVFDSFAYLDELQLPKPKTATVLGYGPVGEQVARALKARGVDVVVYDPDPARQARAAAAGHSVQPRDVAIGASDLVVGCTGRGALSLDDYPQLKNGAVLVNGASGNHEMGMEEFGQAGRWFREMAFEPERMMVRNGEVSALFGGRRVTLGTGDLGASSQHRILKDKRTGKEALVLRSGHVVNLGRDLPPEFIQITRALVLASLLQASQTKQPGVVDVDAGVQSTIRAAVDADLLRQGLSWQRPDFTTLRSWDL